MRGSTRQNRHLSCCVQRREEWWERGKNGEGSRGSECGLLHGRSPRLREWSESESIHLCTVDFKVLLRRIFTCMSYPDCEWDASKVHVYVYGWAFLFCLQIITFKKKDYNFKK